MSGYQMEEIDELIERKRDNNELLKILECPHENVVREYFLGTHSDYVCLDCGMKSLSRSDFK